MIVCAEHGSAQFLMITESRIKFDRNDELEELNESYRCRECGATGEYRYANGYEAIVGDIEATDDRPQTIIDGQWNAATDGGQSQ